MWKCGQSCQDWMSGRFVSGTTLVLTQVLPSWITSQLLPGCGQHIFSFFFPSVLSRGKCDNDHSHHCTWHPNISFLLSSSFSWAFFCLNPLVLRLRITSASPCCATICEFSHFSVFCTSGTPEIPREVWSRSSFHSELLGMEWPLQALPSPKPSFPVPFAAMHTQFSLIKRWCNGAAAARLLAGLQFPGWSEFILCFIHSGLC